MPLLSRRKLMLSMARLTALSPFTVRTAQLVRQTPAAAGIERWLLETGRGRLSPNSIRDLERVLHR